jgi:hypothetical protein
MKQLNEPADKNGLPWKTISVAIGYSIYRKYLLEIRTRSEKYAEIREQIRRLLADLLTTPDEDLIRQLHRTIIVPAALPQSSCVPPRTCAASYA